ncbi:MAG TPA: CBS domain-containing protein [Pyrinomonadaceae bacterium]|nr:CBS domain-containing protein [Pyrinomonadaceae bacterium]
MLVEELMTREVESCRPESSLAEAAGVMWRRDCGAVPVVDGGGGVVGMITDRDICMALATRREYASDVRVGEVMAAEVVSCTTEDDVREALEVMRQRQLRRLPVVDSQGRLTGILSVADVLRRTRKGGGRRRVKRREALATLKAVFRPRGAEDEGAEAPDGGGEAATERDGAAARDEAAQAAEDARPAVQGP